MNLLTLKEFAEDYFVSEANVNVLPLFDKKMADFKDTTKYLMKKYAEYLFRVKGSLEDKIKRGTEQNNILKDKITTSAKKDLGGKKVTVVAEITENRDILDNLVKDRGQYIKYLDANLKAAQKFPEKDPKNALEAEVASFIRERFEGVLQAQTESLKVLEHQRRALLSLEGIKAMEGPKFLEIFARREAAFKKDVSETEQEIEDAKALLLEIDRRLQIGTRLMTA